MTAKFYAASCADCDRRFVYSDSCARHRAVCAVRLRKLLAEVLLRADSDSLDGFTLDKIRDVLAEDGQGR